MNRDRNDRINNRINHPNCHYALNHFEDDGDKMMNKLILHKGFFDYEFDFINMDGNEDYAINFEEDETVTVVGDHQWINLLCRRKKELKRIKRLRVANITRIPALARKMTSLVHLIIIASPGVVNHPVLNGYWKSVRVITIALEQNPLPQWIMNLQNLEALFVYSHRYFSTTRDFQPLPIPVWIGNLVNLKALTMSGPQLNSLPHTLRKLKNLKYLNLGAKSIHMQSFCRVALRPLGNLTTIMNLSASIGELRNLKILDLSFTRCLGALPDNLKDLVKLESLNLERSGLVSNRRLVSEMDKKLLLQLPSLHDCQGIDYDDEITRSFLSKSARSRIFHTEGKDCNESSEPRRSFWPWILAKGASSLGPQSHRAVKDLRKRSTAVWKWKLNRTIQLGDESFENDTSEEYLSEAETSDLTPSEEDSSQKNSLDISALFQHGNIVLNSVDEGVSLDMDQTALFLLLKEYSGTIVPSEP